jgi:hypothetical protein
MRRWRDDLEAVQWHGRLARWKAPWTEEEEEEGAQGCQGGGPLVTEVGDYRALRVHPCQHSPALSHHSHLPPQGLA